MGITVQVHPDGYEVRLFPADDRGAAFAVVRASDHGGTAGLFMTSPAACDELIKAAAEAKRLLTGGEHDHDDADLPWVSGVHGFIPCTTCTADACNACGRPAGDAVHRTELDDEDAAFAADAASLDTDIAEHIAAKAAESCTCGHAAADHHLNVAYGTRTYCNTCAVGDCAVFCPTVIAGDFGPEITDGGAK